MGSAIRGRLTVAERSQSDILLIVHWMDTNYTDYHELLAKGKKVKGKRFRVSFRTDVRNLVMRSAKEISQSVRCTSFRNDQPALKFWLFFIKTIITHLIAYCPWWLVIEKTRITRIIMNFLWRGRSQISEVRGLISDIWCLGSWIFILFNSCKTWCF